VKNNKKAHQIFDVQKENWNEKIWRSIQ